jgi:hypothetical protein
MQKMRDGDGVKVWVFPALSRRFQMSEYLKGATHHWAQPYKPNK